MDNERKLKYRRNKTEGNMWYDEQWKNKDVDYVFEIKIKSIIESEKEGDKNMGI